MEAHYTVYLILISFMRAEGKLHWTIENKISDYGQNLTLMCSVVNCCSKAAGWEVWEPTLRTLFIDIRNWTVPATSKYTGDVHNFGYTLVIRNVSQEDLNITYTCVYGVERSDKKMLIESDIFFSNMEILGGHKQNKSTLEVAHQMKQFNKPNNDINIELVIGLTVPGVLMVIVGLTFVYLKISHRKPRPISKKNSEEGPTAMKEGNNGETEMLIKEDEEAVNRKEKNTTLNRNVGPAQTVNIDIHGVSIEDPVKNSKRDTLKTDEEAVNRKEKNTTLNRNVGPAQTVNIDIHGVSIEDPVKNSKRDTLKTDDEKPKSSQELEDKIKQKNPEQVLGIQEASQRPREPISPRIQRQESSKSGTCLANIEREHKTVKRTYLANTEREHTAVKRRKIPVLRKKKRKPDHYMDGETNEIDISNEEETETVFNS